ncbi:hypothetical protein PVAP13_9KG570701 [Panicum virgatum]|uniref:Uncharacterized protein n=1 Tax=Panicum virgatum TaxID=38727 RepID=A0A8T0P9A2_PANVG|nr:hypothetical protein PVAP13_9KG570701 [Panicum virgatum]
MNALLPGPSRPVAATSSPPDTNATGGVYSPVATPQHEAIGALSRRRCSGSTSCHDLMERPFAALRSSRLLPCYSVVAVIYRSSAGLPRPLRLYHYRPGVHHHL